MKNCLTCRYWSSLVAKKKDGELEIEALCLNVFSGHYQKYASAGCDKHAVGPSIDEKEGVAQMTINGKAVVIGDVGLRYEVSYFNSAAAERQVMGWSGTFSGAQYMSDLVDKHPKWPSPKIKDRG